MSVIERDPSPAEAWARVRIHLNLLEIPEAIDAATTACRVTSWATPGTTLGGPVVQDCPEMPIEWCFLDPWAGLAVLNTTVVDEFAMSACLFDFVRAIQLMDRPGFRRIDVSSWRRLTAFDIAEARERRFSDDW